MTSNIVRNRTKCIICYGPHSSMENGPGYHRQFAEASELLKRAFDIKFPKCFDEYGEISICRPCFEGEYQEAEVLFGQLMEIENQFKTRAYNLTTMVIDSVYKSGFLNQNPTGNAFDSTRFLLYQRWLRFYTKDKKTAAVESNAGLEEMDVDNEEDQVKMEPATETTTALNKSKTIQWDSNKLVNGKLEKLDQVNAVSITLKEKEEKNEVAADDNNYKNLNSIIAHENEGTFINSHYQQQIVHDLPTTAIKNKFYKPLLPNKKKIQLVKKYYPQIQKVGHPSANNPKMNSAAYVNLNLKRPQVPENQLQEQLAKRFSAQVILKPVTDISDPTKFNRKKLIYMKRDPKTGKITCMEPPTNISNLDLIKKSKVFTLVRDGNSNKNKDGNRVTATVGSSKIMRPNTYTNPNYKQVFRASPSKVQQPPQQPQPKPIPSRFDNSYDNEEEETSLESANDDASASFSNVSVSELNRKKNPAVVTPNQSNQVHKHKLDQTNDQGQDPQPQPEISPAGPEVKRSKRTIKKPMHYDEQNYIYDSAGNGKEVDRLILQTGRKKLKGQKETARSNRIYRPKINLSLTQEELEAEAEEEELEMGEMVYVPNKWNPSTDNPVDSEEEDIELVKNQQFVIENSDGEEIDYVDFKGRKRNGNGAGTGAGQGQKPKERIVRNRNLIIEEVDEDMIEKEKLTEEKSESNKFKCVFCPKLFSSLEKKIEHEVFHAAF